jgi:hypothetical protein
MSQEENHLHEIIKEQQATIASLNSLIGAETSTAALRRLDDLEATERKYLELLSGRKFVIVEAGESTSKLAGLSGADLDEKLDVLTRPLQIPNRDLERHIFFVGRG